MRQLIKRSMPVVAALLMTGIALAAWYFMWAGPAWLFLAFMMALMASLFLLAYVAFREMMDDEEMRRYFNDADDDPQDWLDTELHDNNSNHDKQCKTTKRK